ncbi:MAG: hypothetical protein ABIX37_06770 [Gammaproteobacteria bacterium]
MSPPYTSLTRHQSELEAAMKDPGREFNRPADVAARHDWSVEERHAILRQWKYDLGQLHLATEENMPPSGKDATVTIGNIHEAMESLGVPTDSDSGPSKGA